MSRKLTVTGLYPTERESINVVFLLRMAEMNWYFELFQIFWTNRQMSIEIMHFVVIKIPLRLPPSPQGEERRGSALTGRALF